MANNNSIIEEMNNYSVNVGNYDRAYCFGASRGQAMVAIVDNASKQFGMAAGKDGNVLAFPYDARKAKTTAIFSFASTFLTVYAKAFAAGKQTARNILLVLPDDAAIRAKETANKMTRFDTLEEVIASVTNKNWGIDPKTGVQRGMAPEMQEACAKFAHAYADCIEAGINLGFVKHTNLKYWELLPIDRSNVVEELKDGMEIHIEGGVIQGLNYWKAENRGISGDYTVEAGKSRNGHWFIQRQAQGAGITNLRNADKLLNDNLPGEVECTMAEGGIFQG